jgi:hypothetical protein
LRALATEHPATPKVQGDLAVPYRGARWDVKRVPGVNVGDRLHVLWSPLLGADGRGHATAVTVDPESGREIYHPLPLIEADAWGWRADAPESGKKFAQMPETQFERNAKRLAQFASGTDRPLDDALARKRKDFQPLAHLDGGRGLNPFAEAESTPPQSYLPRRGTEHRVAIPQIAPRIFDHVEAAMRLKPAVERAGGAWGPERFGWLAARYPAGVPEEALAALEAECVAAGAPCPQAPGLRIVRT